MVSKVDSYLNYASKAVERKSGRGLKPDFHIFYIFIITVLVIQIFFILMGFPVTMINTCSSGLLLEKGRNSAVSLWEMQQLYRIFDI